MGRHKQPLATNQLELSKYFWNGPLLPQLFTKINLRINVFIINRRDDTQFIKSISMYDVTCVIVDYDNSMQNKNILHTHRWLSCQLNNF